jgi:hypothetical protein
MFGRMMVTPIVKVGLRSFTGLNFNTLCCYSCWCRETPNQRALVLDRKRGTWYSVDFDDKSSPTRAASPWLSVSNVISVHPRP